MIKTTKPVDKDKIIFNTQTYYTCSYTGAVGVKILKLVGKDKVLVQNKGGTFIRPIKYVFETYEDARRNGRNWEHDERKRKREKKQNRKKEIKKKNTQNQGEKTV